MSRYIDVLGNQVSDSGKKEVTAMEVGKTRKNAVILTFDLEIVVLILHILKKIFLRLSSERT